MPPRRLHRITVTPTIAATRSASGVRNEVGPHSVISGERSPTASCEVSSRGPTGVRQAATRDSTGTEANRAVVRPS